jgi:hypothetical protein
MTPCACPTCDRSRRIYAEAAANVAAGTTTAPTWAELEADDTTRVRLSRWARRGQRGPTRPEWMDDPFISEDRPDLFDERSA